MKKHLPFAVISLFLIGSMGYFYTKFKEKFDQIEMYAKLTLASSSLPPLQDPLPSEIRKGSEQSSQLCSRLSHLPLADDQGIVLSVTKIDVPDVKSPYNASLIFHETGFHLFYRYDTLENTPFQNHSYTYKSKMGVVSLNKDFSVISPSKDIDTKSFLVQDPRAFKMGSKIYLAYNDVEDNLVHSRQMRLAELRDDMTIAAVKNLDLNLQPVEKNWVPFTYEGLDGEAIYFEYSLNPHKIIKVDAIHNDKIEQLIYPNKVSYQHLPWLKGWGPLRGGTPAILVDGQYLAFFHSSFKEEKKKWYVMGAYTFESKPPFRITAISPHPILFKGIYDTRAQNTSSEVLRCIFPSGIVLDDSRGKEVIHVSCGENDSGVKIVTFDKNALLCSLNTIAEPKSVSP